MFSIALTLFTAGVLTILLPCILPLIPIVLGVSIVDKNRWKPLVTVAGMLVSFVGSTFLLQVLLSQFVELADYIRIGTFYILLLFGLGFFFHKRAPQMIGAVLGSIFFWDKGIIAVIIAAILGVIAVEIGGRVATAIQQFGTDVQTTTRSRLGANGLLTSFIIGLTMGLVWVPCAGPALGFALSVVRDQPGLAAFFYLTAYGVGAGLPLILIGYGGQAAVHSVRFLSRYSGYVKQISGVLLIISAIGFQYSIFQNIQTWLATNTTYGRLGTAIEESFFDDGSASSAPRNAESALPILGKAPEAFVGLSTWHNSQPLDLQALRGKVVLIDFWTYSCINCIRTLPYIEALAKKYGSSTKSTASGSQFVLIGVHTPEFIFEKSDKNVANAIRQHGLTYPIVQDNDFGTWNAFSNRYWPAKYLIDAEGNIRYEHFGEGAYDETDEAIASLLKEIGMNPSDEALPPEIETVRMNTTPELYLHSRSWRNFGNSQGSPDANEHTYTAPASMEIDTFYLSGTWQLMDDERQVLLSDSGEIRIRALGGEVNLVMGLEGTTTPVDVEVVVDGKPFKTLTVQNHDLYTLFEGDYGEHHVVLQIRGKGVSAYAFTFGS